MTADSVDLEDCDNLFKNVVGMFTDEVDVNSFLNPPYRKSTPVIPPTFSFGLNNPLFDTKQLTYDLPGFLDTSDFLEMDWQADPLPLEPLNEFAELKRIFNDPDIPAVGNSSHSDMESELFLVPPNSILPSSEKDDDVSSLDSVWPDIADLSDEKLIKIVDNGFDNYISLDEVLVKKTSINFAYLDIDHCYSQRPPVVDVKTESYFNSAPCSPASSSCSDQLVGSRGMKRSRPKRKAPRRKKIKQEVASEDEEVDVETPCTVSLVVPKITISISPPPIPAKRGRKPKGEGQTMKKPNNKNCPVSPKVLQAAINQQKKKCYITKSGRVTKISNSVETTPSTSTPSSLNNSRCSSDMEDNVDKRASHNMAERNRRQELTNLFQQLRKKVPEIKNNSKASKVAILQSSTSHVCDLEEIERQKALLKEHLKAEMENKLAALVQSLKSCRAYTS